MRWKCNSPDRHQPNTEQRQKPTWDSLSNAFFVPALMCGSPEWVSSGNRFSLTVHDAHNRMLTDKFTWRFEWKHVERGTKHGDGYAKCDIFRTTIVGRRWRIVATADVPSDFEFIYRALLMAEVQYGQVVDWYFVGTPHNRVGLRRKNEEEKHNVLAWRSWRNSGNRRLES